MNDADLFERFSVLLFVGSSTHGELLETWLSGVPTKVATTPEDIFRVFDSSVAVACFSQSLLEDDEEEIRRYILNRNPYCQLVLITSSDEPAVLYEQHYDAIIDRPVSKSELQTTVETRLTYAIYSVLLDEFYSLNAELVSLQRASASEGNLDQEKLQERLRQVRRPLESLKSTIDHDGLKELLQSLDLHRRYLTEPARNVDNSTTSKYHPDTCSNCNLPWGVDHRNELGNGFTQIGAYVWKCARCNDISHGSGPSDRHIARR